MATAANNGSDPGAVPQAAQGGELP
jgi:hypothetical protein